MHASSILNHSVQLRLLLARVRGATVAKIVQTATTKLVVRIDEDITNLFAATANARKAFGVMEKLTVVTEGMRRTAEVSFASKSNLFESVHIDTSDLLSFTEQLSCYQCTGLSYKGKIYGPECIVS